MPTGRSRTASAVLVLLLVGSGCAAGSTGGKAVGSPGATINQAIKLDAAAPVILRQQFEQSPKVVNAFWTTGRLKQAQPPIERPSTPSKPTPRRTPTPRTTPPASPRISPRARTTPPSSTPRPRPSISYRPASPTAAYYVQPSRGHAGGTADTLGEHSSGAKYPRYGLTASTNGRLYFTEGGKPYVCSATVVHSPHKNIVATAAHCVWNTGAAKGSWNSNFMFIPADRNNGASTPYGRWFVKEADTNFTFMRTAIERDNRTYGDGWRDDFAVLRMQKTSGKNIETVTGGQGMAFNVAPTALVVIGYPTAPPFDGNSERYCATSHAGLNSEDFGDLTLSCTMTPGCSGGAWLTRFAKGDGVGYLVGVTSLVGDGNSYSAHLNSVALSTYQYAVKRG